jgi:hypothetical protein
MVSGNSALLAKAMRVVWLQSVLNMVSARPDPVA